MHVIASDGTVVINENWSDQPEMPELIPGSGEYLVRLHVPPLLRAGDYVLGLWLGSVHTNYFDREALRFSVLPRATDRQSWLTRRRAIQPEVAWSRIPVEGDDGGTS